jgi:hypothetical protein
MAMWYEIMSRCGAETLSDGDAILECPVHTSHSATHVFVPARGPDSPEHRNWHLMVFLGLNLRSLFDDHLVHWGSPRYVCAPVARSASIYDERKAANVGSRFMSTFRDIIGLVY